MSKACAQKCTRHQEEELERKEYETPYKCNGCKMEGIGLGYGCKKCDYVLHSQCANPRQYIRPAFKPHLIFKFTTEPVTGPQRYCDACGMRVNGFVYHCFDIRLGYDLHPCCASLQTVLKIDNVELVFDTESKVRNCHGCNSKFVKGRKSKDGIPGWCYVYEDDPHCGYHVFCVVNRAVEELKARKGSRGWSLSKKKSSAGGSDAFYTFLTALVNYVIAILSHDPIAVAKLVANDLLQIAHSLTDKL